MVRSGGKRSNTRDLYSRAFRKKGALPLSQYLINFKIGEYVDIVTNSAVQQGMPYKFYHGKTGRVFNISRAAVGVEVNKQVGNRIIAKRFHVRVEHVRKSKCAEKFKQDIRARDKKRREAREAGSKLVTEKRQPKGPADAHVAAVEKLSLLEPIPYRFVV
eukprot:Plantae.Rhodophyta-Rhodochaete_pulchella.ctg2339.p1 GENE.Plantae.Rhodophyta-Rhodochaete_pulchella.ctg2339~~Plantae.Rhodophyta-Rhodochaete_pulchella.ctg2339.p1  ORF type:complete len:186 (+),score=28.75 Plantae.Rhodophyta-Rhodochaete_pulchella.ctg2339:81-560(+)